MLKLQELLVEEEVEEEVEEGAEGESLLMENAPAEGAEAPAAE